MHEVLRLVIPYHGLSRLSTLPSNESILGFIIVLLIPPLMSSTTDRHSSDFHSVSSNSNSTEALSIYDWDDTILPTSWLRSLGYLSNNISDMLGTAPPVLPAHVASMMRMIEEAAIENLRAAGQLGRVVIVTNSSVLWVPFTAKRFFPRLSQIVDSGFEVYSARPTQAENAGPNYVYLPSMAVTWKQDKFRDLVGSTQFPTCVSIGDGFAERCAVLSISSSKMSGKAVRFPLQPSGTALLEQLRIMIGCLKEVVDDTRTGDLYLNTQTGSYRIIPVQPAAGAEAAIPLKMEATTRGSERLSIDTKSTTDANGAGLIQSLASGIAYCGRTLTRRMSIGNKSGNTPKAADQKPVMTMFTNKTSIQYDENSEQSSESIRVEVTNTTITRSM